LGHYIVVPNEVARIVLQGKLEVPTVIEQRLANVPLLIETSLFLKWETEARDDEPLPGC
jgi:hypothetical protein